MNGRLFDSAFKKREEAAKKWREENDLQFTDINLDKPIDLPPIPIIGLDHRSESPVRKTFSINQPVLSSPVVVETSTSIRSPFLSQSEKRATEVNNSTEPVFTSLFQSTNEEKQQEIPSEHTEVPEPSHVNSEETPAPSKSLLEYVQNLSAIEKASVVGFALVLCYFHFSFNSWADVVASAQTIPVSLISSGVALASSISFEGLVQWFSRFTAFDYFVIVFVSAQFTMLFDSDTEATDAYLSKQSKEIKAWTNQTVQSMKEIFHDVLQLIETIRETIVQSYDAYQRRTPKIVQLFLLLTVLSVFLRYGLSSLLALIDFYLVRGLLLPFRWYFLAAGLVGVGYGGLQVYLCSQRARKEVVAGLVVLVKELLSQKKDCQAPVDYLFFEVDDFFLKTELHDIASSPSSSSSSRGLWRRLVSSVFGSGSNSDREGEWAGEQVAAGSGRLLRRSDLRGFSLASLWGEVVREVGRDRRIRTIHMFVDGAQRKCWKIASSAAPEPVAVTATAVPQSVRPILS